MKGRALALLACCALNAAAADVVIYGSSPAALAAAVKCARLGVSAVVVSPETRIGGLTTGGLGQTDIGNKRAFRGIALEFYREVARYYRDASHWTRQPLEAYSPDGQCAGSNEGDAMWTFEPSAALVLLEGWERRYNLDIRRGERLDRSAGGVVRRDGRIVSLRTESGRTYAGKVFIDATYEGDLMAAAGVSYRVGREANAEYGETISGVQRKLSTNHQLWGEIDPYVEKGNPASGLLPGVEADDGAPDGSGDRRVQAYCFRMCLTDDPANRIPFARPDGYDERDYELLFRNFERGGAQVGVPWINSPMPNRKTDTNNRTGFSTDLIGGSDRWPEASYAERAAILARHLTYQRGLMWTLANHPRVPQEIRDEVSRWGTCRDEFLDGLGDGWQRQLYVREARRLVGETVMTEAHCRGRVVAARPIAYGAYGMDSHNCRRYVAADGSVRNEGNIEDYCRWTPQELADGKQWERFGPFPIDYGAIVPKRGECGNLLVPVCLSATHMAFGSIRMEPVFFALGEAAGAAAALSVASGTAIQDVPYPQLAEKLGF